MGAFLQGSQQTVSDSASTDPSAHMQQLWARPPFASSGALLALIRVSWRCLGKTVLRARINAWNAVVGRVPVRIGRAHRHGLAEITDSFHCQHHSLESPGLVLSRTLASGLCCWRNGGRRGKRPSRAGQAAAAAEEGAAAPEEEPVVQEGRPGWVVRWLSADAWA